MTEKSFFRKMVSEFGNFGKVFAGVSFVSAIFLAGILYQKNFSGFSLKDMSVVNAQTASTSITQSAGAANMDLYWEVYNLLEEKQVKAKEVKGEQKLYGAIQGLAASYNDPYTMFFPPAEAQSFKTAVSGSFEGVGMEIGLKDKIITVIAPLKGSPAEKAGMKADDKIISINATSTENMSTEAAIKLIRGPKGTPVTLKVFRSTGQKMLDITITRDKIELPIIETQNLKNAFKISLYSFSENSPEKFQAALKEFSDSGKKNLILDLRNNPGGYLEAAVIMASFFVEKDKIIVSEDFTRKNQKVDHVSKGFYVFPEDYKIVVLVNKGSASASEILSGALQDHAKAKIVGEVTFGKGSVQEYMELRDGTALKITVAKWLTPLGKSISDHGVTPDIIVPFKENPKNKKADNQLDYAVAMFSNWKKYEGYSTVKGTNLDPTAKSTTTATTTNLFNNIK